MGRDGLANFRCVINISAMGPLVNKMRFLTHTRLTHAKETNQSRKMISLNPKACVEGPNVPSSVLELWSGWMTRTHPDSRWQCHVIKASKQRIHVSMSLFPCRHSKVLWSWFYSPILLICFVFWLFLNFWFFVLNSFIEVWPTSRRLIKLWFLGWWIFTLLPSRHRVLQHPTSGVFTYEWELLN